MIMPTDKTELFDIQKDAVKYINHNFSMNINTLCATSVGSGKTRIACEIIKAHLNSEGGYILVCCPNTKLLDSTWTETLQTVGIENDSIKHIGSDNFKANISFRNTRFNGIEKDVYLITYKMLISRTKGKSNSLYFKNNPPSLIVFDEMHYLSNNGDENKQSLNAVKEIPTQRKLGLTATPLVNDGNEIEVAKSLLNSELDEKLGRSFIFYRNTEYTETASNQYIIELPLSVEERDTLYAINTSIRNGLTRSDATWQFLITGKYEYDFIKYYIAEQTSKNRALKKILEQIPKEDKVIVFDKYIENLKYLKGQDWMKAYNPTLYTGESSSRKDEDDFHYKRFTEKPSYRVLLTTMQKSGEGLNLQVANHVIMLSFGWTPKEIIQASGRVKRRGQKKPVFIYILKGKDSKVEDDQLKKIEKKCDSIDARMKEELAKELDKNPSVEFRNEIEKELNKDFSLGFKKTLETEKDKFLKNEKIEEDVGKFIDSVQEKYMRELRMLLVVKTIEILEKEIPNNTWEFENIKFDQHWETIKELCNLIIDLANSEISKNLKNRFDELESKVETETKSSNRTSDEIVIQLRLSNLDGCISILYDYLSFINEKS